MSISSENHTPYMPSGEFKLAHNVGFCFLKPDYKDAVDEFSSDLQDNGLAVMRHKEMILPPKITDYIYSDSRGEDFYSEMSRILTDRSILAMVVARTSAMKDERPTQDVLESLKRGSNGYPNLREKYYQDKHRVSDPDLAAWKNKTHPNQDDITYSLTQGNVFHASDGPHDAIGTLLRIRNSRDPQVADFFNLSDVPKSNVEWLGAIACRLDIIIARHDNDRDMSKITREWRIIQDTPESVPGSPIRQVYVWLLTADEKVIIVSKDGENWQLPGGKPDPDENTVQTAVREVHEETGVDLSAYQQNLTFFGEYTINDPSPDTPDVYRQVRSWVKIPQTAAELDLTTGHESTGQRPEDAVRFVQAVPVNEVHTHIPWLPQADEYKALKRTKIISV